MTTMNPFDLLGDDDTEDLSQLIAAQKVAEKAQPPAAQAKQQPAAAAQAKSAKQLPSKPAQAGREANNEIGRGGGRGGGGGGGGGRGRGRGGGGGGFRRDFVSDENSFSNSGFPTGRGAPEDGESGKTSERRGGYGGGPRGAYRGGGRRGGFSNGDVGEGEGERPPRRTFERRSGTGRGNELKREGSGRGNWGSQNDEFPQVTEEVNESEKNLGDEKPAGDGDAADVDKGSPTKEPEEKEPEDKEMTLEEYQKVLEEKKKSLQALKAEERKVDVKEFESMQQISSKKANHDVFIKLGSDKDKKKEAAEKEEKAKKAVPITEFLKPAEGERHYNSGGRGGRGRGGHGGGRGGTKGGGYSGGSTVKNVPAPSIEDPGQFPTLGAK